MNYFILIKIIKNKWLFLVLTMCVFLCIVSACVLPMFEDALIGRMLIMKFNKINIEAGSYTNRLTYSLPVDMNDKNRSDAYYSDLIENDLVKRYKQKIAYFNKIYSSNLFEMEDITFKGDNSDGAKRIIFITMNNFENNMHLISGRFPSSSKTSEGYIEIAVSNETAIINDFVINRIYKITNNFIAGKSFVVKITGIFNYYTGGVSSLNSNADKSNVVVMERTNFLQTV
ncbi:MAG: hypothetical protein ACYCYI_14185 [Saccharofermentanales bacterium]